ncbi:MAG: gluconate 2-dehydrogenase subunit 3 family protein [Proteobacteria bacterium]|nr:gluconate 2-dehydrogenase subunit 3 family protein [Pseudomonadota bacterium]
MKIYTKQYKKPQVKSTILPFTNKPHWTNNITRRDFVKSSLAVSLLAGIAACKPNSDNNPDKQVDPINYSDDIVAIKNHTFTPQQHLDLQAVYMRLFPDDGDGPSANDLNVVTYLEWAMTDERNINDGDPEFISKGIGWLNKLANDDFGKNFTQTSATQQDELITQTINAKAGKNWVSILTYYLIEAVTLDPYYGGNTNQIGWQWLEHQGGFPHPIAGKTYKDFE